MFIGFPGVANNTASPSANSFAFNGLTSANIQTSNITCSSWTISAPSITCVTSSSVTSGTVITFLIGCSTSTGATCTSVNPIIINPSKTNPVGTGDLSKIRVSTFDASANELDTAAVSMTTIEGVVVSIGVEESMTFTIGGINNGQPVNTQNTTGCSNTETTNSGVSSTSSLVSLGILGNTPKDINTKVSNIAAQLLTISTNATGGYVISATSSALRSKTSSATIASSTTPSTFPNAKPWFGLHPCGLDVTISTWNSGANQACNSYITGSSGNLCKYGWPGSTPMTISSDSTGPVGNDLIPGNGYVSVQYAAGVDSTIAGGEYQTVITYVATPSF